MAEFTIAQIKEHNDNIKSQIKSLDKPLGAYQLYCQAMREHWNWLADCEKQKYEESNRYWWLRFHWK